MNKIIELDVLELNREELLSVSGGGMPPVVVIGSAFGAGAAAAFVLLEAYEWGYNLVDRACKRSSGWN